MGVGGWRRGGVEVRLARDKALHRTRQGRDGAPGRACPGYYLRLSPDELMLGAGMHRFQRVVLARYRQTGADPATTAQLDAVAAHLQDG